MNNPSRPQVANVSKNKLSPHDLSHQHLTTLDFFRLQPIMCMETIPGDNISFNVRTLLEAAPLATKVYGSCHLDLHAFFVPFRLLYDDWDNYYYGNSQSNSQNYTLPFVRHSDIPNIVNPSNQEGHGQYYKMIRAIFGSLGYPTNQDYGGSSDTKLSLLPARAYQRIWWDWYRDSQHIEEKDKALYIHTDGGDVGANSLDSLRREFLPRFRRFRKDYINTLLKSPQMGESSVASSKVSWSSLPTSNTDTKYYLLGNGDGSFSNGEVYEGVAANASLSSSLSVPLLRGAVAMQHYLERLGVLGSRPLERIFGMFGVRPSVERLDMSELIGTKTINIGIDGLLNIGSQQRLSSSNSSPFTSDDGVSAFGTQQGRANSSGQSDTWQYNATEKGYIMVIASVIPDYVYGNTIDRLFYRGLSTATKDRSDFFIPDLDGSQYTEVLLNEVCAPLRANPHYTDEWNDADMFQLVGYHPYAEDFRYILDKCSGDFVEPESRTILRNMMFVRDLTEMKPSDIVAGLNLTTPTHSDRVSFDNHFQVTNAGLDHFVMNNYFVIDALRPVSSNTLPTELSDLANRQSLQVSYGGVAL